MEASSSFGPRQRHTNTKNFFFPRLSTTNFSFTRTNFPLPPPPPQMRPALLSPPKPSKLPSKKNHKPPPPKKTSTPPPNYFYNNVQYERAFDPYSDEPWPNASERWILYTYPPNEIFLSFPKIDFPDKEKEAHLIGFDCEKNEEEDKLTRATWKEVVVYKEWRVAHVYNLVSHSRQIYRSLIFTSDSRFSCGGRSVFMDGGEAVMSIKNGLPSISFL